jgi:hypothetical protein
MFSKKLIEFTLKKRGKKQKKPKKTKKQKNLQKICHHMVNKTLIVLPKTSPNE